MLIYDLFNSFLFVAIVECVIQSIMQDRCPIFLIVRRYVYKRLKMQGCLLKTKHFVRRVYDFSYRVNYIYNRALSLLWYDNYFNLMGRSITLEFVIYIKSQKIILSLNNFVIKNKNLIFYDKIDDVQVYITINPNLIYKIKITNSLGCSIPIKFYFKISESNKNIFSEIMGNLKKTFESGFSQIEYDGEIIRQKTFSFKLNLFSDKIFDKTIFYADKKEHSNIIYLTLRRDILTNYSKFKEVARFINKYKLKFDNIFCVTLFSHSDYTKYKKILNNINEINKFNIQMVVFYKNCYCLKNKSVHYIDYYSDKLHIFNFLLNNYSYSNNYSLHKCSYTNLPENIYDYLDDNYIYHLSKGKYSLSTQVFNNFIKKRNCIVLQNQYLTKYYNFCDKVQFVNNTISCNEDNYLIISNKYIAYNKINAIMRINSLNADKKLFINFWQDTQNEQVIYDKISESIQLCRAVSIIYYINDKFNKIFNNLFNYCNDDISQLILFYYLIKGYTIGIDCKKLVIDNKLRVIKNLIKCYELSHRCHNNEDLIILYLHTKNLLECEYFKEDFSLINKYKETLYDKVKGHYEKLKVYKTYDEIINHCEPNFVNYELLFDYLLKFQNGFFKFKANVCTYDNVFNILYMNRNVNVWVQGAKLSTIKTNGIKLNENLYLPYNLDNIQKTLNIVD